MLITEFVFYTFSNLKREIKTKFIINIFQQSKRGVPKPIRYKRVHSYIYDAQTLVAVSFFLDDFFCVCLFRMYFGRSYQIYTTHDTFSPRNKRTKRPFNEATDKGRTAKNPRYFPWRRRIIFFFFYSFRPYVF